jgi:hypothetical protein
MMAKQFQMSPNKWNALFGCKAEYQSCKTQGKDCQSERVLEI